MTKKELMDLDVGDFTYSPSHISNKDYDIVVENNKAKREIVVAEFAAGKFYGIVSYAYDGYYEAGYKIYKAV